MKQISPFIFALVLLSSCSTMNFITIDVLKPSEIPIEFEGGKVVLADNSIAKTSDNSSPILLDALAQFLNENGRFEEVSVYPKKIENNLSDTKLKSIFKESEAEKVIILRSYEIASSEKTTKNFTGGMELISDTLWVHFFTSLNIINKDLQSIDVTFRDSLFWNQMSANDILISAPFPEVPDILKETAIYVATKIERKLVPYWDSELRWYYTNGTTRMKEAAVAAENYNWEKALSIWHNLYYLEKNETQKAKLASNMALSYEMTEKLDDALYWISIAQEKFPEKAKKTNEPDDKERARLYSLHLKQRISDNEKLNR